MDSREALDRDDHSHEDGCRLGKIPNWPQEIWEGDFINRCMVENGFHNITDEKCCVQDCKGRSKLVESAAHMALQKHHQNQDVPHDSKCGDDIFANINP